MINWPLILKILFYAKNTQRISELEYLVLYGLPLLSHEKLRLMV